MQLAAAKAEQMGYLKQADAAMRDGKTAEAQIAQANADKAKAQIDLLVHRIEQARILSPVTGTLVTGTSNARSAPPSRRARSSSKSLPWTPCGRSCIVPEDEVFDMVVGQEGKTGDGHLSGPVHSLRRRAGQSGGRGGQQSQRLQGAGPAPGDAALDAAGHGGRGQGHGREEALRLDLEPQGGQLDSHEAVDLRRSLKFEVDVD